MGLIVLTVKESETYNILAVIPALSNRSYQQEKINIPDEDVDFLITALGHYYSYAVAKNVEDVGAPERYDF